MSASASSIQTRLPLWDPLFQNHLPADKLLEMAKHALFTTKVLSKYKFQAAKVLCGNKGDYSDADFDIVLNWRGEGATAIIKKKSAFQLMGGSNGTVFKVEADLVTDTEKKTVELAQKIFFSDDLFISAQQGADVLKWIWSWCPPDKTSQFIRPPVAIENRQYFDLYADDIHSFIMKHYKEPNSLKTVCMNFAASADALDCLGEKGVVYLDYKIENLLVQQVKKKLAPNFAMTDFDAVFRIPVMEDELTEAFLKPVSDLCESRRKWPPCPSISLKDRRCQILPYDEIGRFVGLVGSAFRKAGPKEKLNKFCRVAIALRKMQAFIFGFALLETFSVFSEEFSDVLFGRINGCFTLNASNKVAGFSIDELQPCLEKIGGYKLFALIKQLTNFKPDQRIGLKEAAASLRELANLKDSKRKRGGED